MQRRYLGSTGMSVNDTALGTMMFGAWGNTDRAETVRMVHRAIDAGIDLIDTADVYAGGETEEDRGRGAAGPPRRSRAGDQVRPAKRSAPQPSRITPMDSPRARGQPAPAAHRPHRSLSVASLRLEHRPRRNPWRAHRLTTVGAHSGIRPLIISCRKDRRSAVGRRAAWSLPVPHRATALLNCQPGHRGIGATHSTAL